jgi:hypothetical protein
MSIVNLAGAIDLHIHSNPSLFKRIGSDLDIAKHAAGSQLAAVLIKNHFESTVGRAFLADEAIEGTRVFGGLVLNHFTGGLNPSAVETAVSLGAKQIWMPTIDALGHADAFGHTGGYGYQESNSQISSSGITILNDESELVEELKIIVELVKAANVILGTAHLSRNEIFKLAEFCNKLEFNNLLITHPYFDPPKLNVKDQAQLYELGATIELCGGNLYPIPGTAKLSDYLESISTLGARPFVISSDSGQPRKSMPAEVLRVFAQCLIEKGVSQDDIDIMTKENPQRLLNL